MSYFVAVEASIFLVVFFSFFSGESINIHCIWVVLVASGEPRCVQFLYLCLESHDPFISRDYLLESSVLGVEFDCCIIPLTDHGRKWVLSKNLL